MSQERQWTDPVSLGSVNRDYDQGFADGCSESKRLNENLVAAFAQGRAAGLEALDVEVILDTMKQYFSTKESPFGAGGTIVQGGIGSVIEFAHAIRSISPTSSDAGKDDAREKLLYDLRKEGEQRFVKPLKFPDGYCTSPNGAIVPRAGAAEDYNFGYDVGFSEAWEILAKARTSTPTLPATTDTEKLEAARYRWLRDMDMFGSPSVELSEAFQTRSGGALDSAIDQIMSSLEVIGKGEKG